jgi:hypothetical protein
MMNTRSRLTGICTGDQTLFCTVGIWRALGGYAEIDLMEDIDFSRRASRLARPAALRERVTTSARRWHRRGVLRTILTMWLLRALYFFGASPARLHAIYHGARR